MVYGKRIYIYIYIYIHSICLCHYDAYVHYIYIYIYIYICNTLSGFLMFFEWDPNGPFIVEEFISLLQNDQAIDVLQDVGILPAVKGEKTAGNISVIWLVVSQIGSKYFMFDSRCHEMIYHMIAWKQCRNKSWVTSSSIALTLACLFLEGLTYSTRQFRDIFSLEGAGSLWKPQKCGLANDLKMIWQSCFQSLGDCYSPVGSWPYSRPESVVDRDGVGLSWGGSGPHCFGKRS